MAGTATQSLRTYNPLSVSSVRSHEIRRLWAILLIKSTRPTTVIALVKTYGNQGITGFLQLTGAIKSNGVADEVQYWEETRLHPAQSATPAASAATGTTSVVTSELLVQR
jgi:hypothetical protein